MTNKDAQTFDAEVLNLPRLTIRYITPLSNSDDGYCVLKGTSRRAASHRFIPIDAAQLRFRPILMTSLAFTLGVVPLAIATGANAASQNAIGTGMLGGMISATVLAVFFVPVFFVFVMKLFGRGKVEPVTHEPAAKPAAAQVPAE